MDDIADWLISSTSPMQGFWVLFTWGLSLSFSFWLYTQVLFSSNAFPYGWLSSEGMITIQLPRGKQIPWSLWLGNIQSSHCVGLQEQGISSFYPSFQLLGCKKQVRVASGVSTIHFVPQHALIFVVQALREIISFHLPMWFCWTLPGCSNQSIWTCCNKFTPNSATFSLEPCFRE